MSSYYHRENASVCRKAQLLSDMTSPDNQPPCYRCHVIQSLAVRIDKAPSLFRLTMCRLAAEIDLNWSTASPAKYGIRGFQLIETTDALSTRSAGLLSYLIVIQRSCYLVGLLQHSVPQSVSLCWLFLKSRIRHFWPPILLGLPWSKHT